MFRIFYWSFEPVMPAVTTSYRVDILEIVKRLKEAKLVLLWKKLVLAFFFAYLGEWEALFCGSLKVFQAKPVPSITSFYICILMGVAYLRNLERKWAIDFYRDLVKAAPNQLFL